MEVGWFERLWSLPRFCGDGRIAAGISPRGASSVARLPSPSRTSAAVSRYQLPRGAPSWGWLVIALGANRFVACVSGRPLAAVEPVDQGGEEAGLRRNRV